MLLMLSKIKFPRSVISSFHLPRMAIIGISHQQAQESDVLDEAESESTPALHVLRLSILEKLVQHVPQLKNVGGVTSIPFMQVKDVAPIHISRNRLDCLAANFLLFSAFARPLNPQSISGIAHANFRTGRRRGERQGLSGEPPQRRFIAFVHE